MVSKYSSNKQTNASVDLTPCSAALFSTSNRAAGGTTTAVSSKKYDNNDKPTMTDIHAYTPSLGFAAHRSAHANCELLPQYPTRKPTSNPMPRKTKQALNLATCVRFWRYPLKINTPLMKLTTATPKPTTLKRQVILLYFCGAHLKTNKQHSTARFWRVFALQPTTSRYIYCFPYTTTRSVTLCRFGLNTNMQTITRRRKHVRPHSSMVSCIRISLSTWRTHYECVCKLRIR